MLKATLVTVLLCLVSSAWTAEDFADIGATGRGPRILEQKADSGCKQEKSWQVCSDEDWGPKCPSGCRVQGLTTQTDKEFSKRIDVIKQKLKDGESSYKSIDIRTKETYEYIKGNLVAAQQTSGAYNQVTENLRRKIDFLKTKVTTQIDRIKLLQRNIRNQVVEMKRLEVDIDIKLRSCKGSCAKGVDYNVDHESYENIQKQLLQAESTDLKPNTNAIPMLKMRPIKDAPLVDSRYKTLAQNKELYPTFSEIGQFRFVLEGKGKEQVTNCPNGCRVQGLITKFEKEIVIRMETAKQSLMTSNPQHIKTFSEIKHLHDVVQRNMLTDQDTLKTFAHVENGFRKRLMPLKLKVKEQAIKIEHLLSELQDQLAVMKRLEVDIDIKVRSCKGSCRDVHMNILNLDNYESWNKLLNTVKNFHLAEDKSLRYINLTVVNVNVTNFNELFFLMQGKGLSFFEHIDQYMLTLGDDDKESENESENAM